MEHYLSLYLSNPLFMGIDEKAMLPLLQCMQAQKRSYRKGSVLFSADEPATALGLVLSGRINTVHQDVFGGNSIVGSSEKGQLFCEAFSCSTSGRMPVSVVAQTDCEVLLIQTERILHTCANSCAQHHKISENLVHILAEKYVSLNQKVIHLSERTTRRKLLSYLSEQAKDAKDGVFAIPFNQQELADYLFIDRSGLSMELNKMKREGIIDFDREKFRLLQIER